MMTTVIFYYSQYMRNAIIQKTEITDRTLSLNVNIPTCRS